MRKIFHGALAFFLGVAFTLLCLLVIWPQYSDYRAMAETYGWLSQLEPIQNEIERKLLSKSPVEEPKENIKPKPDIFKTTRDGVIILRGGRERQILVLMPLVSNNEIYWVCIGGSKNTTPAKCK